MLKHSEGFEPYAIGDDRTALVGAYDCAAGSSVGDFAIVAGHANGRALRVTYPGPAWALPIGGHTTDSTLIRSFRLLVDALPASNRVLVTYHDFDNDELATWVLTTTGAIELRRGGLAGTLLGTTAAGVVAAGAWLYLEPKITFHASTGSYTLRVLPDTDPLGTEQVVLSGSGVNTTGTGGVRAYQIWHGGDTAGWTWDDTVLVDTAAGLYTDFIGDVELVRSDPIALAVNQWTPSDGGVDAFTLVDDDGSDGDATHVKSNVVGEVESYEFSPVDNERRVAFVAARVVLRKDDAGSRGVIIRADSGGQLDESSAYKPSADYTRLCHPWEADPATGGVWGPNGLKMANFGAKTS